MRDGGGPQDHADGLGAESEQDQVERARDAEREASLAAPRRAPFRRAARPPRRETTGRCRRGARSPLPPCRDRPPPNTSAESSDGAAIKTAPVATSTPASITSDGPPSFTPGSMTTACAASLSFHANAVIRSPAGWSCSLSRSSAVVFSGRCSNISSAPTLAKCSDPSATPVEPALGGRALVPFLTGGIAFARAADALGEPDLGLRIAEGAPVEAIGEFGTCELRAHRRRRCLQLGVKSGAHYNTGARVWLTDRGDEAWFHRSFVRSFETGRQQVSDYGIRLWLRVIERGCWAGAGAASALHFEGRPPRHAESLRSLAHVVRFEQPFTAIVFPRALLALPMPSTAKRLYASPGTRGAWPAADALGTLRQAVEALVSMGQPSLRAAADAAGTSARSLQRQLEAAGQSFHGLRPSALRRSVPDAW